MAKILFIEDEEFSIHSFICELEDRGHEVVVSTDGEGAIRCLNGGSHNLDLIILDIMLPRGDHEGSPAVGDDIKTGEMGLEILRQLRIEMRDATPIIVHTAAIDDDLRARVLSYGVERHFCKPVSLTDLIGAVEEVLASAKSLA